MPWFVSDAGSNASGGTIAGTSLMTSVAASITANALGNWTQLHAAAPFPVSNLDLMMGKANWGASSTNTQALLDIGFGINPNEAPIVQNVAFGGAMAFASWTFPIYIPVGSRIVMRIRSAVGSKSNTFAVSLSGGGTGMEAAHAAVTYGAVTATSIGTVLTTATLANTKSAWTTITAATTSPARWILVGLGMPNTTLPTVSDGLLDIGMGAAAAESVIVPDNPFTIVTGNLINGALPLMFPVSIPAGIRLAARYQSTSTAATAAPNVTITGFS